MDVENFRNNKCLHMYKIAFVSTGTSATVHSSTLDSRNSSFRAAKGMIQPPFQSNTVFLSAKPAKTIAKCVSLARKGLEVHAVLLRSQQCDLGPI